MDSTIMTYLAENLGLATEPHPKPLYSITGCRLMTDEGMKELIDTYSPLMKALEPAAAGAYIIGMLGGMNAAVQYMVSHNTMIDLSPERWTLQLYMHKSGYVEFLVVLESVHPLEGPLQGGREQWREEQFSFWYGNILRPLIESIARITKINTLHLWKLVPMRLRYMQDRWKGASPSEEQQSRYEEDWQFLGQRLGGDVFGLKRNPLDVPVMMVDYPAAPGQPDVQYKMKTACCMYHRTEGGEFCYTCPRLKPADRELRKEKIRARLAEEARIKAEAL